MLSNYLKYAVRGLLKQKLLSFITIFGLGIGIASSMYMIQYAQHELSYDHFFEDADQIYKLSSYQQKKGKESTRSMLSGLLAKKVIDEVPEVTKATRISSVGGAATGSNGMLVTLNDKRSYVDGFYFADNQFLDVFSFPLISGNPETALEKPNTTVLTKSFADRLFGNESPIGKVLTIENKTDLEVTGIIADLPTNTQFSMNMLVSYSTRQVMNPNMGESWLASWDEIYLQVETEESLEFVEDKIFLSAKTGMGEAYGDEGVEYIENFRYFLQPLKGLYLAEIPVSRGDIKYIYIFAALAILIVLMAFINTMNISAARYNERIKELAVRKTNGATKRNLQFQFVTESFFIVFISFLVALSIFELFSPFFESISGVKIQFEYIGYWEMMAGFLLVSFLIGIASGAYPSVYLSSLKPSTVLKGAVPKKGAQGLLMRKLLVGSQLSISSLLIIVTILIGNQLEYTSTKSLGFDKESVMVISTRNLVKDKYDLFKNQLLSHSAIDEVSTSSGSPGNPSFISYLATVDGAEKASMINAYSIDYDFFSLLDVSAKQGRVFSSELDFGTKDKAVVNETFVKEYEIDDPIGKQIKLTGAEAFTIVGVVEDFHYESLREQVKPLLFHTTSSGSRFILARIASGNISEAIDHTENAWKEILPEWPIEYSFIEDDFSVLYSDVRSSQALFKVFSIIAILIGCLGLLGVTMLANQKRVKDMGIHKVFGATAVDIFKLLTKDLVVLSVFSFTVAIPLAYLAANRWLEDFAYRISIGADSFALAASILFSISLFTIGFHVLKVSISKPVEALKEH